MRTPEKIKAPGMVFAAVLALGLATVRIAGAEVWLQAEQFTKTMPDSTIVSMWGFRLMDTNWTPLAGQSAQVPGPRLVVPPGEGLTVHLKNSLPDPPGGAAPPISLVIPGQVANTAPVYFPPVDPDYPDRVRSFAAESTPGGGTADFVWANLREGTYLYHSGTHPQVQVQMGLYGGLTKDYAPGEAYSGVPYTVDRLLLYSEIDPALHGAVTGGTFGPGKAVTSTMEYEPKYALINGASYPDPAVDLLGVLAADQVLLRFLNAGLKTHIPLLQGLFVNLVAEDGHKGIGPGGLAAPYPRTGYSVFLPAGQTADALLLQPVQPGPCNFPIFDRSLYLTNAAATGGGMYTALTIINTAPVPPRVDDTLLLTRDPGGSVQFQWTDLPGGYYYKLYESTSVGPALPPFASVTGGAASGSPGLSIPVPSADLVFYLVAASNYCGVGNGPQN